MKEGGTKICSGGYTFYDVSIEDPNEKGPDNVIKADSMAVTTTNYAYSVAGPYTDSITVTYKWVTVKYSRKAFDDQIRVTALPNTTGKKRTLYIREFGIRKSL